MRVYVNTYTYCDAVVFCVQYVLISVADYDDDDDDDDDSGGGEGWCCYFPFIYV